MAAELFSPPSRALDGNGNPYSGAQWRFYASGTSTPQAVYADADLSTSLGATVTADSGGKFVPIYFDTSKHYRGVCRNASGSVTLHDIDPINPLASLVAGLGDAFGRNFDTVAGLIADETLTYSSGQTSSVTSGDSVRTLQEGYSYKVAPSGASDWHLITAGGVKLYVQLSADGTYTLDAFGTNGTQAGDSAAFKRAIATAPGVAIIRASLRRYFWDNTPITADDFWLIGAKQPRPNSGNTALEDGTIFEGGLIITGQSPMLHNVGGDNGSTGSGADVDGIKITSAGANTSPIDVDGVAGLCKSPTSNAHGVVIEGYTGGSIRNVIGRRGFAPIVFKVAGCTIENLDGGDCAEATPGAGSAAVYGKSSASSGGEVNSLDVSTVRVSNFGEEGLRIQADDSTLESVSVRGVQSDGSGKVSIMVQCLGTGGASLRKVQISDVISQGASEYEVRFFSAASAEFSVGIDNLVTHDSEGKIIDFHCEPGASINMATATNIKASYKNGTDQAIMDAAITLDSGVNSSLLDNVEILENYGVGSKVGAIVYNNSVAARSNILGARRCKVLGAGRPQSNSITESKSGATATLTIPADFSGTGLVSTVVTIAAATTATTAAPELSSDTYEAGSKWSITNNNLTYDLTIAHNPGGGFVNRGSTDVVIPPGVTATWTQATGSWHSA